MPHGNDTECPCCGKKAHGTKEIEKEFGYRNMGDGRATTPIPQSYCRECRLAGCKAGEPCKVRGN